MRTISFISKEEVIKDLLSIGNLYEEISYDDSPSLQDYTPTGVWFFLKTNGKISGFINLKSLTNIMWSPHIYIFKQYRGKDSVEWGLKVEQCMRDNFEAKRFLAFTPYESARIYAERMGFRYITTLPNSIKKNGEFLDQYILGK